MTEDRDRVEDELVCPSCGEQNAQGRPHAIQMQDDGTVECSVCNCAGPLALFMPPVRREGWLE